jgi:hypothetical protein
LKKLFSISAIILICAILVGGTSCKTRKKKRGHKKTKRKGCGTCPTWGLKIPADEPITYAVL